MGGGCVPAQQSRVRGVASLARPKREQGFPSSPPDAGFSFVLRPMSAPIHRLPLSWTYASASRWCPLLARTFREWHRAHKFGLRVDSVAIDGRSLTGGELVRLNAWIASGGAWRCSAVDPWTAHEILTRVLQGFVGRIPNGGRNGGRWTGRAAGSALRETLDGSNGVQGEFWPDL